METVVQTTYLIGETFSFMLQYSWVLHSMVLRAWTLTAVQKRKLFATERAALRSFAGPSRRQAEADVAKPGCGALHDGQKNAAFILE